MAEAYVAVGSNIDPAANVLRALDLLLVRERVAAASVVYRTPAIDRPEQDDYRNAVWQVETDRPPAELKTEVLRGIEATLGRVRGADRYAARTVDLDLVIYGDLVHADDELVLPDPDIRSRPFVAVPLLGLAPELVLPDDGARLADLPVARVDDLDIDAALTAACRERIDHEHPAR